MYIYICIYMHIHVSIHIRIYIYMRRFELFISNRECVGFPFLHKDMCATHAMSMQVQGIKR